MKQHHAAHSRIQNQPQRPPVRMDFHRRSPFYSLKRHSLAKYRRFEHQPPPAVVDQVVHPPQHILTQHPVHRWIHRPYRRQRIEHGIHALRLQHPHRDAPQPRPRPPLRPRQRHHLRPKLRTQPQPRRDGRMHRRPLRPCIDQKAKRPLTVEIHPIGYWRMFDNMQRDGHQQKWQQHSRNLPGKRDDGRDEGVMFSSQPAGK